MTHGVLSWTCRFRLARSRLRALRRLIPRGAIGMLMLLVLIESIVAHHEPGFASSGPWDWQQASKRAERAARSCDVLCFGDSQLKLGVLPGVIEERTGRRAFNLALIGGQMPAATVLLRRVLDAGARPAAVVLETLPPLLSAGVDRNDRHWPELLDLGECVELARTEADSSLFARLALAGALPSVRARHDVRAAIQAALGGQFVSKLDERAMHRRNWAVNRGAMPLPDYGIPRQIEAWYQLNYDGPWKPDPTNAAYLRRFLRMAAEHDIDVYWLLAPIDPEAQALVESGGHDARFEQLVRRALVRFPNLTVIDGRRAGFPRAAFTDELHLHAGGARVLSESLASILNRQGETAHGVASRAAPDPSRRWLALPPFHSPTSLAPIEDLSQSQLAVRNAEERRR